MGSYLVLEFCDGGTLDGFIVDGPSSLHQAWSYFRDVLLALNYLHSWVRFRTKTVPWVPRNLSHRCEASAFADRASRIAM